MSKTSSERWDEINDAPDTPATRVVLLRQFLHDFPEFGPAHYSYGIALADVAHYEEAEHAFQLALTHSTERARPFVMRSFGHLFREKGDFNEAEKWFRKAIATDPQDTNGYIYLGGMFARLGRLTEAEAMHRRATQCVVGCIDEAYHNLGLDLRAMERYPEALECFDRALQIDPHYAEARRAHRDVKHAMEYLAKSQP